MARPQGCVAPSHTKGVSHLAGLAASVRTPEPTVWWVCAGQCQWGLY